MGDFLNSNQSEFYWSQQNPTPTTSQTYYEQDYSQFGNQQLEFNSNNEYGDQNFANYPTQMLLPEQFDQTVKGTDEFDEPPLLEELEIYPDRIVEKVLAVLNPLRGHSLADDAEYLTKESDLAGCLRIFIFGYSFNLEKLLFAD
nr:protein YIPF5 [Leptinotarsa decemlineata]